MKLIPLTQGQFAQVDDSDYDFLMQWKWHAELRDKIWYARRGRLISDSSHGNLYMHRIIMKPVRELVVDHIDHNGLNNQKSNLRICTRQQNQFNGSKQENSTSGFYGVRWDKARTKWCAELKINSKKVYMKRFSCEIEAAKAYDEVAKKYRGDFANLNFK